MTTEQPKQRGGLRSPPGGRPKKAETKIKTSITISQEALDKAHRNYPNEPLSQVIDRLLLALN